MPGSAEKWAQTAAALGDACRCWLSVLALSRVELRAQLPAHRRGECLRWLYIEFVKASVQVTLREESWHSLLQDWRDASAARYSHLCFPQCAECLRRSRLGRGGRNLRETIPRFTKALKLCMRGSSNTKRRVFLVPSRDISSHQAAISWIGQQMLECNTGGHALDSQDQRSDMQSGLVAEFKSKPYAKQDLCPYLIISDRSCLSSICL